MYALLQDAAISGMRGGVPVKAALNTMFGTTIGVMAIACPAFGVPALVLWGLYWMWRLS